MADARPRPLVAGNWKMNGLRRDLVELAAIRDAVAAGVAGPAEVALCLPATLLALAAELARDVFSIGAEDTHPAPQGAFTGDLAAEMLADVGATYVIVGHSERRIGHGETDETVRAKAAAAWRAGLVPIVCVGETAAEREAGATLGVVERQLAQSVPDGAGAANLVVAYEPVWAIGTGLTPTVEDVAEVHMQLRGLLASRFGEGGAGVRLLYGGSCKPDNAAMLMGVPDVDGALVGGASLRAVDFLAIAGVYA
ncbi:MAG TPA: triose-phosphate isomerase [Hyphomicrobiales bacterium]|nr:triose-phosphate isomerase [Hyphomicrobiales bacterium]